MTTLEAVLFIIVLIFIFWCVQSERRPEPESEEMIQARLDHMYEMTEALRIENANALYAAKWLTNKAINGLILSFSEDGKQYYDELSPVIEEPVPTPEKAA